MPKRIIENDEYDFTISRTTKYIVAISAQLLSWGIWVLFSTPATIEFCRRLSVDVKVLNVYSGEFMGIVAGVTFSILEMLFTYFWLWKRNNIYWIGIGVCMAVSIAATTGFTNIGHQQANIKYDSITNAEKVVKNLENKIETENNHINNYDLQIADLRHKFQPVDDWLFRRRRQAVERLDSLTFKLNLAIQNESKIKKATGAIITLDPIKSKNKYFNFSNFIAIILEIFIVVLLIAGNAVWKKIDPPQPYQNRTKSDSDSDSDLAKLADVGQLSGGLKSGVRPIVLSAVPQKKPIGFGRSDSDKTDQNRIIKSEEKVLHVNSVEAICMVYDHFVETNQSYTKKGIADMVGCDESWVRKILKRERGV